MRKKLDDPEVNMTPMIDVVFQLMIFFIVTIKMNEAVNEDVILEDAVHGPVIHDDPRLFTVELDQKGRISIRGKFIGIGEFRSNLKFRKARYGTTEFPILIKADYRAKHQDVRKVMDTCTDEGIWRLDFIGVKEHKATGGRHQGVTSKGLVGKGPP